MQESGESLATCTKPSGKKFSEPGYVAKMIRQKLIWIRG